VNRYRLLSVTRYADARPSGDMLPAVATFCDYHATFFDRLAELRDEFNAILRHPEFQSFNIWLELTSRGSYILCTNQGRSEPHRSGPSFEVVRRLLEAVLAHLEVCAFNASMVGASDSP